MRMQIARAIVLSPWPSSIWFLIYLWIIIEFYAYIMSISTGFFNNGRALPHPLQISNIYLRPINPTPLNVCHWNPFQPGLEIWDLLGTVCYYYIAMDLARWGVESSSPSNLYAMLRNVRFLCLPLFLNKFKISQFCMRRVSNFEIIPKSLLSASRELSRAEISLIIRTLYEHCPFSRNCSLARNNKDLVDKILRLMQSFLTL